MRSLITLLIFITLLGATGYGVLIYLANLEPRTRVIEEPVDPELFNR
tara:strand:- start:2352 stop:2492 length:141 start_codon:yes stop_codon:yes gene_type:complete